MAPQRTQNFNSIRLTTSNNSENNIILQEISGQLYINDHLVVTSNNIASLTKVTTIESNVTTLQSDVTTIESDVTTLQSDVTTIESDVTTLQSDVTAIESDVTTLQSDVTAIESDVQSFQGIFNISTRDTEANIIASTPTNPSGEVTVAYGTDTGDFYIYYGSGWYIYKDDTFANTYSLSFDGTNDYIDIPDSTDLETTAFTWSAWFYCTAINRYNIIVDTATSSSTFNGYELFVKNTDNKIRFASYSSYNAIDSSTVVSANTWYHVAATHESGSDKLYVNGTLEASGSAGSFSVSNAANLRIGSSSIFNLHHQGLIDEVSFFNSALSASDVSSIYNNGVPADISSLNPVGWWRMGDNDSGTGTTITDQGSGGNNATLTNGPTFSTTTPS